MNDIEELLKNKSAVKIRKGAVLLQKNPVKELEHLVYDCLYKELLSNKSWETISELIKAAGINQYKSISALIDPIVRNNKEYDMITISSGLTFFRLQRSDLSDIKPLENILPDIKYSLGYGMLDVLGYDRMVPKIEDCEKLINFFYDFGKNREDGFVDPRYGLAAACAGWDKLLVADFLNHCIKTGDTPLKYVSEYSLKGKYVKLR